MEWWSGDVDLICVYGGGESGEKWSRVELKEGDDEEKWTCRGVEER